MIPSTALVTGASGYIAIQVTSSLLEAGWTVHATVRGLQNKKKTEPLRQLEEKYPGNILLFEADLLVPDSFLNAVRGCSVVFHIASPFLVPEKVKDPRRELVEPAVHGTRNVLDSVNKTDSVKRVVLTSSVGAIYGDNSDVLQMGRQTLHESYFNESSSVSHNPYQYSKILAEKEAWEIAKAQSRWDLVVICPGFVMGPSLTPSSESGSLFVINQLLKGYMLLGVPDLAFIIVDVRDVAAAHVKAAQLPEARGRYIISDRRMTSFAEISRCIKGIHEKAWLLPGWTMPNFLIWLLGPLNGLSWRWIRSNLGIRFQVDNSRGIKELGMEYRPVEETLTDHYHCWVAQREGKQDS